MTAFDRDLETWMKDPEFAEAYDEATAIIRAQWTPLTLQLSSEERQDLHAALVTVLEDEDLWWGEEQRARMRSILERIEPIEPA